MAEIELVLGVGCQRDTPLSLLERGVDALLAEHGLSATRVRALASIDHKRNEPALLELSRLRGWPITFYSVSELGQGVAEPAALRYAQRADLLVGKFIYREPGVPGSMTLAIAELAP